MCPEALRLPPVPPHPRSSSARLPLPRASRSFQLRVALAVACLAGLVRAAPAEAAKPALKLRVLEGNVYHLRPVYTAAAAAGIATTDSDDWTILWSYASPFASPTLKSALEKRLWLPSRAKRGFLINHLPGTVNFASKVHLVNLSLALAAANPRKFSGSTPQTFVLPEQSAEMLRRMRFHREADGPLPRWLVKSKKHRGIRVLTEGTAEGLQALGPSLVQERIRPLLLRAVRRQFDVGLYVLVSSVRPLVMWAHELSLVRFCLDEYPRTAAEFEQQSRYVIKDYTPIWKLPEFSAKLSTCDSSAACVLKAQLKEEGWDADGIFRRMHALAAGILTNAQPTLLSALARKGLQNTNVFEMFRFDFIVNSIGRPVLTEVNLSPNLVGKVPEDTAVKQRVLADVLHIVSRKLHSSEVHPSAHDTGGFRRILASQQPR